MWVLRSAAQDVPDRVTFRLTPGSLKTLGRAPSADFVVDVPLVSRFHCRFSTLDREALEVEDLNSTNGTFVNERRVKRAVLVGGDRVRVGRLELLVEHDAASMQTADG